METTESPLVSVITVVRNGVETIVATLESVSLQRDVHVEHIVIDGASIDGTVDILRDYQGHQLLWISEADKGIYDAMNKGLILARGEWIIFLGADDAFADSAVLADIFLSQKLAGYDLIGGKSSYHGGRQCIPRLDWHIRIFNTLHHQAAFYRRSLFKDFKYRLDIPVVADYELNFQIYMQRRSVFFVNRKIAISGNQGISHTTSQLATQIDMYKIRRRYINTWVNIFSLFVGVGNLAITRLIRWSVKSR